jgi:type IV secretion system protein VirB3
MDKTTFTDPLFLGLTRPAMVWGVPQPFFVLNGMVSMIVFLVSNSFYPLLIGAPLIHAIGYLLCLKDVRILNIWLTRAKFLRCLNRRYWGANSYDPFL